MEISVVVPVYNGEKTLRELCLRLEHTLRPLAATFEVILVDDRSPDSSWEVIREISSELKWVRAVRLSRNFGQHPTIAAGLSLASGQYIVVMDCDLQDKPEEIEFLYQKCIDGYDLVLARRVDRQDSFIKKSWSKIFYALLGYLTETQQDPFVANFGVYKRKVIVAVLAMKDSSRYFPTMVRWVGFRCGFVDVQHCARTEGASGYDFKKRLKLGLSIILAFSDKPLRIVVKFGLLICVVSFLFGVYAIVAHLLGALVIVGWASTIVVICFFSGTMIFVLGFVGLYVGRIYDQVKGRPIYYLDETLNLALLKERNNEHR